MLFTRELDILSQKSEITYAFSHNYARIKIDSYDSLPLEKILNFHVTILIKSSFNKKSKITTTIIYFYTATNMFLSIT